MHLLNLQYFQHLLIHYRPHKKKLIIFALKVYHFFFNKTQLVFEPDSTLLICFNAKIRCLSMHLSQFSISWRTQKQITTYTPKKSKNKAPGEGLEPSAF